VTYLEDGDWTVLSRTSVEIRDASGQPVARARQTVPVGSFMIDRGNYRHFMAKEIHEQPEVVGRTLAHYVKFAQGRVEVPAEIAVDWPR
jgi:glucosamine--fructose-6-phosphate aminotransferase (isomerizing)